MDDREIRERLRVPPEKLRRTVDPAALGFRTTADIQPIAETVAQARAVESIEFGVEIEAPGFNLFVAGESGTGRESTIRDHVERAAMFRRAPSDWVYVYNFASRERPNAIPLPSGRGAALAKDMDEFVHAARREIPRAFDSDDYAKRRQETLSALVEQRRQLFEELDRDAHKQGFSLQHTPAGFGLVPLVRGEALSPEQYERLMTEEKQEFERRSDTVQNRIGETMRKVRRVDKEAEERVRQLDREIAMFALRPLFDDLFETYADLPEVVAYLNEVKNDVPEHLNDLRGEEETEEEESTEETAGAENEMELAAPEADFGDVGDHPHLQRYRVNVLVSNGAHRGAPVVFERNPTYYNLLGRIEYRARYGTLFTDFRGIRAGALLRANGGYLIVRAMDVLSNPFAWDMLKRTLRTREVQVENLGDQYVAVPTATLKPEPIPLNVKVVLLGPRWLYQLMWALDEDFRELFKVKAEFSPDMAWNDASLAQYAGFLSRVVRGEGLLHLDASAVARVIEHGARLEESQRKLSARLSEIADVVTEASHWARKAGRALVSATDVTDAVHRRTRRSDLVEERMHEFYADGTILMDTTGTTVGQINGLAVMSSGDHTFGRPSRITATVGPGRGQLISIEREIELSGKIHSKGVLILAGYLRSTYGREHPLALSASLTFEQSYDEVDGDSASSTELYAMLSALSGVPLRQGIAVTGSVNQRGEVQAVGGVVHKIEGFYQVCKSLGLDGTQGVMIPASNVPHLMLEDEVLDAIRAGRFHVWAVKSIDEGIELLMGTSAGKPDASGVYPEGSVHRRVFDRLTAFRESLERRRDDHDDPKSEPHTS